EIAGGVQPRPPMLPVERAARLLDELGEVADEGAQLLSEVGEVSMVEGAARPSCSSTCAASSRSRGAMVCSRRMWRAGGLAILAALVSCGAKVSVDASTHIDVCGCWAVRQTEAHMTPANPGPCLRCWVETIIVHGDRSGVCHDDQQRCLTDVGCQAVSA